MPREEGGKGLLSIEGCLELAFTVIERYIHSSDEKLIQASTVDQVDVLEGTSILKTKKKKERRIWRLEDYKIARGSIYMSSISGRWE